MTARRARGLAAAAAAILAGVIAAAGILTVARTTIEAHDPEAARRTAWQAAAAWGIAVALVAALPALLAARMRGEEAGGPSPVAHQLRVAAWHRARAGALAAMIARLNHDLRGILSPALLSAERLQGNADATVSRTGDMIVRMVDRATEAMRGPAAYARDAPLGDPASRFELRGVIDAAAAAVASTSAAGMPRLDLSLPDGLELEADRAAMVNVFAELLRNAAEARARSVRIAAMTAPGSVVIEIADDGPGLPATVGQDPFAPHTGAGAGAGSGGRPGFGLAIARDTLRANGGDIALAPRAGGEHGTAPGTGAAFVVTIAMKQRSLAPGNAAKP